MGVAVAVIGLGLVAVIGAAAVAHIGKDQAETDPIDALARRLCEQQYPAGYNEDGISLPDGGWADALGDPASVAFLEAWRDKARNVITLLDDAGYEVVYRDGRDR